MRALIQRVKEAHATVDQKVIGKINQGILLLLGIHKDDDESKIPYLVEKVAALRIFEDSAGKMDLSLDDIGGKLLIVSQFTLYGECEKGRRPSFINTMKSSDACFLYESFVRKAKEKIGESRVETGSFGAEMQIHLVNDGPVTFLLSR
ncbi:MAG: D-tyrosyl-tRNA(Tyr) deacylase [Simkaniaceae bacterium]|nr:D-tyrosyl-tRNA(Tyr) deacylase [Simkaniaceae bacterium]